MPILKFAAAIAAGVVALGVAAYAYFLYSPDPTPPHLSGRVQTATIQVGSRLRSYVEYIPGSFPQARHLLSHSMAPQWTAHLSLQPSGRRTGPPRSIERL